jgi:hypothetical protein
MEEKVLEFKIEAICIYRVVPDICTRHDRYILRTLSTPEILIIVLLVQLSRLVDAPTIL